MSQSSYNFTATRSARIALAMKRIYSRKHIASWSLEPVMLVPSPSPREKTSLMAHPAMPLGTIAWVEGTAFVPSAHTKVFTSADLHPRRAGIKQHSCTRVLRQRECLSESVVKKQHLPACRD